MALRIPNRIRAFPGWDIRVVQLAGKELNERFGAAEDEYVEGTWDQSAMTIFLKKNMSLERRLTVLGHELDHALNDWRGWIADAYSASRPTK